jgi:hypothetical protein
MWGGPGQAGSAVTLNKLPFGKGRDAVYFAFANGDLGKESPKVTSVGWGDFCSATTHQGHQHNEGDLPMMVLTLGNTSSLASEGLGFSNSLATFIALMFNAKLDLAWELDFYMTTKWSSEEYKFYTMWRFSQTN